MGVLGSLKAQEQVGDFLNFLLHLSFNIYLKNKNTMEGKGLGSFFWFLCFSFFLHNQQ